METVEFSYYPAAFVGVKSFTKYTFGGSYTGELPYDAYIIRSSNALSFETAGFTVIKFDEFSVCHI